jgi:N-acetylmuramic acid 6-phosphate etherase
MNNGVHNLVSELDSLKSEERNPNTLELDQMPTRALVQAINDEDQKVATAIKRELDHVSSAVDEIVTSLKAGGRLIYIGAGTSGRLGVLDAVECPPTFSVCPELVVGIIAGGEEAINQAVEGAEDNFELGIHDLIDINVTPKDAVVGIAASGRTPYVIGALEHANSIGCSTISVTCNKNSTISKLGKVNICASVGPECLTGSTRLKAGSAQKMILNMLSTAAFVKLGKVYQNLMVDVNATNEKLRARAIRIVMQATSSSMKDAEKALDSAKSQVKVAILMLLTGETAHDSAQRLQKSKGYLRKAMKL